MPRTRPARTAGPRASFRQLLPHLTGQRGPLAAAIALSIIASLASLAQPLLVGLIVARVQSGLPVDWTPVAGLVALVVVGAVLGALQHYLLQRMGEGVVLSTRRRLIHRLLRLPIAEFDVRRTGDLVSRVGADATLLRAVLTQGLVEAVGGALTFVGALVAMAIIDPMLLGVLLGVLVVAFGAVGVMSRFIRRASAEAQTRVGSLTAAVERAISGIRTIRAANATEREERAIDDEAQAAYRAGLGVARASAGVMPIAGIAMQLALIGTLGLGGLRVAAGAIDVAGLSMFLIFLFMLLMPVGQIIGAISSVNQALGALGRIQEVIELPIEADAAGSAAGSAADAAGSAAIVFEGVEFAYAQSPEPVLRGVSFEAEAGVRTAIVGPSGAGKSTILQLIERFYEPGSGRILLGGVDLASYGREALRQRLGYVEQDAPVLAGSLRENLRIAAPDADDAACEAALRRVNLGDVLDRHPAGLDAQVGEGGVMLSGGERQRLAIARTLLAGAPILLLDEATAALDGTNERLMREAIDAASVGRTVLVIAHRLATVVDAERIVVLDDGLVVGIGSHAELLESTPLYRELARTQLLV